MTNPNKKNIFISAYYLTKCVKDDPDVNECLINSGNRLIQFLKKGVPELGIFEV